jgi:sulfur carrier protein ThiS
LEITVKLYATLTDFLPPEARRDNLVRLHVPDDASLAAIIEQFRLPAKQVHLVLVNGFFIPPKQRAAHRFKPGDVLAIWPPIAGG